MKLTIDFRDERGQLMDQVVIGDVRDVATAAEVLRVAGNMVTTSPRIRRLLDGPKDEDDGRVEIRKD